MTGLALKAHFELCCIREFVARKSSEILLLASTLSEGRAMRSQVVFVALEQNVNIEGTGQ